MSHAFVKWSYLFVVVVCALVVGLGGWYVQHRDTSRLDRADRISCENRRLLRANQQLVLAVLAHNAVEFSQHASSPATQLYFLRLIPRLRTAERGLATTPPCRL